MKVWSNTNTLDGYLEGVEFTREKSLAEIALIGGKAIELHEFPLLKGLFKTGVGTDNIPFEAARERNVEIRLPSAETSDWIFEETANFACYLCLRMLLDRAGVLASWTKFPRTSLKNRNVLILGIGNIGRRVREKMNVFCRVSTYDAATDPPAIMQERFSEADCISLHIPLTAQTRSIIDAEKLGWMKPGAALVNTSRGPVVDEQALFEALVSNRIQAAFDVYWKEPYDGILKQISPEKFLMTPHIASTCEEFLLGCAHDFREFCNEFE